MSNWDEIIKEVKPLLKDCGCRSKILKLKNPKNEGKGLNWVAKEVKILPKLDLHGKTEDEAFDTVKTFFKLNKGQEIRVITGKSGILRQQFPRWCELGVLKKYVKSITLESTGGSFLIKL